MNQDKKNQIHTETSSKKSGAAGLLERWIRKFKNTAFLMAMLPLFGMYILAIGVSVFPGFLLFDLSSSFIAGLPSLLGLFLRALLFAVSYIAFAMSLIVVVPALNKLLPLKVRTYRGNWYSLETIPWLYHNALVQLVRYTVLDLMTPSLMNLFFFRAMGMKVGKNCIINTSNISDPAFIELGDYVTIGGSATIFAHYGQGGYLVIAKTKIGDYSTIGLKTSIMGDVEIGKNCMLGPHQVLLPKTRWKDGEKLV